MHAAGVHPASRFEWEHGVQCFLLDIVAQKACYICNRVLATAYLRRLPSHPNRLEPELVMTQTTQQTQPAKLGSQMNQK